MSAKKILIIVYLEAQNIPLGMHFFNTEIPVKGDLLEFHVCDKLCHGEVFGRTLSYINDKWEIHVKNVVIQAPMFDTENSDNAIEIYKLFERSGWKQHRG